MKIGDIVVKKSGKPYNIYCRRHVFLLCVHYYTMFIANTVEKSMNNWIKY